MLTQTEVLELKILRLATAGTRKFGVPVMNGADQELQDAFERGLHEDWYRLIDIVPTQQMDPEIRQEAANWPLTKIFRLTNKGECRLAVLEIQARDDKVRI